MLVEVLATDGCPNASALIDRLRGVAEERPGVRIVIHEVRFDAPLPPGFSGSPTVLIDGINPFAGVLAEAPACALHPPTADEVEAAVIARS